MVRQSVIGRNLTNVKVPDDKARDVNFEDQLARALAVSGESGASSADLAREVRLPRGLWRDGNHVGIDRDLGRSQKNALFPNA